MKPLPLMRYLAGSATIVAAFSGVFALVTWWSGKWRIATFGTNYLPMAPITAVLFALLGSAVLIWLFWTQSRAARWAGPLGAAIVITASILEIGRAWISSSLPWDHWMLNSPASVGAIPIGQMAPLTAFTFLLSAGALLVYSTRFVTILWLATAASVAAAVGLMIGIIVVVSYASGTPMQYDVQTLPMAWLTGLAFIALDFGLLLGGPVGKFLSGGFAGTANLPISDEIRTFTRRLLIFGTAIGGLIALAGFFHLRKEQTAARETAGEELDAIANLKAEQIASWRNERLDEARFLLKAGGVVEDLVAFAAQPDDAAARARLIGWLEPIKGGSRYESVQVFNAHAGLLLEIPETENTQAVFSSELLAQVLASHEPVFTDLQRDPGGTEIHLDLLVPIRPLPAFGQTVSSLSGSAPVAVIVLRLNPKQFLFPLIQSWPVPSATAENVLVRREGDAVVFLNELRHHPGGALTLSRSVHDPISPAALGAKGAVGRLEGRDYRGVAVLATIRQIPGSPWILVSKIDQSEIYAPLHRAALGNGALIASLLLTLVLTGAFLWRQRSAGYLVRALAAERERNVLSERLALITRHANDIILLVDENKRIVEANERALSVYGRTLEELRQLGPGAVRAPSARSKMEADFETSILQDGATYETRHQRRDGTEFPVEVSTRMFKIEGKSHVLSVIRDITERKQAEAKLRESHDMIVKLTAQVPGVVYQYRLYPDGRSCFPFASPGMNDIYEVTPEEVQFEATPVFGRLHPEDYDRVGSAIQESARALMPFHCEFRVLLPRQGLRWRLSAAVPERTSDGGTLWYGIISDITEQKRAEAALQASEQRYRSILNASPDDITLADLQGRILMVSPAGMKMFGHDDDRNAVGRPVTDFLVPDDREKARTRMALMFQGVMPGANQYRALRRDGTVFDMEVNSEFVRDTTGKPTNLIFVARDITARKQVEAKIAESAKKLLAVLNASPLPHALNDEKQNITFLNTAFIRTFGYTLEDIPDLAAWWPKAYPDPQYRSEVADAWQAAIEHSKQTGTDFRPIELNIRCKDGTDKTVLASAVPLVESFGGEYLVVMQDITERKVAEVALLKANDRLSLATRAGGVGIWDYDLVNNRLIWDDVMYRLYGITAAQFNGAYAAWQQGLHPEDRARGDAEIQAALRGEKEFDTEFRVLWPDGSLRNIRALAMVQRDASGQPLNMIGTNWDITAQKQAEETLQVSLQEKEALLKEVHHRVKNNLQVITSLLRLESGRSLQPDTKSVLGDMQGRIRSMAMLHEALYRSGTFAAVDLGVYIKQITTQLFRALVPASGAIQLHLDLTTVSVDLDQAMPCGLLINELVSNSLKHGFPNGRTGEVRVELQRMNGGPRLLLRISDDGVGLPVDLTSRQDRSLGLHLVSDLTRQLEGTMEIGSGPGASFTVSFTPRMDAISPPFASQPTRL